MDAANALAPPVEAETELSLDVLRRFLMAPAEQFLRQRLGLRLPEVEAAAEDIEPLQAPGAGLERIALQRAVFDGLLAGHDADALQPTLRARGLLPSGPLGERVLKQVMQEVAPYAPVSYTHLDVYKRQVYVGESRKGADVRTRQDRLKKLNKTPRMNSMV